MNYNNRIIIFNYLYYVVKWTAEEGGVGVTTNEDHQQKGVPIHQAYFCEFQRNSNLVWKKHCVGRNTEDTLWRYKYRQFNYVHVFLSKF